MIVIILTAKPDLSRQGWRIGQIIGRTKLWVNDMTHERWTEIVL